MSETREALPWLDGSLYPDVEPPDELTTFEERVDFVARLCGAWDFGILPDMVTVREVQRREWRDVVDACQLLASPTYHLLRTWHNLPEAPFLGTISAEIREDESLCCV
ncbi:MAG: hypothetical protein HC853_05760 [Anaerolineae bacterium]|nr:hypothetical protein [Anaerolineae bacterium]